MKVVVLTIEDLRGFLDRGENVNNNELELINREYERLCDNADKSDRYDYHLNYDNEGYYPPFVAEAIKIVLG